ncbi:SixA phosphatase family protein [Mucilaginibacter sp.]
MKKLLLIRHAKAEHENKYSDFERPLTEKGIADATIMAQRLAAEDIKPLLIIASPALRTHTTANIFSEHLLSHDVETDKKIYDASEYTLLHIINNLPEDSDFVALVGHNPGISQILYYLTGKIKDVPTCAVALIEFAEEDWRAVSMEMGELTYYDEPNR